MTNETEEFDKEALLLLNESDITDLWEKLGPNLKSVATRFLGAGRSVEDSYGIANAAFHSLIRHIDASDLADEEERNGLWPVLIRAVDTQSMLQSDDTNSQADLANDGSRQEGWVYRTLHRIGFKIAENKAKQQNRKSNAQKRGRDWKKQELEPASKQENNDPSLLAEFEELLARLRDYAEDSQQPHLGEILRMKLQECSSKEIAEVLDISEATVSRRLKELRRFIEEQSNAA